MKIRICLAVLALTLAGCAGQDVKEQSKAAVEQRDLLESQRKAEDQTRRAQVAREQEELNRQMEEAKRRKAAEQQEPQVKPLTGGGMSERALSDPMTALKDPASPVFKRSIYYNYDQFDITEEYRGLIEVHAQFLNANKSLKVRIEGNCDERGSTEYNLALGQRRADAVKRALGVLGVAPNRIEAVSFGEEKPKATGQDDDSYAENRRSDIVYSGAQ